MISFMSRFKMLECLMFKVSGALNKINQLGAAALKFIVSQMIIVVLIHLSSNWLFYNAGAHTETKKT